MIISLSLGFTGFLSIAFALVVLWRGIDLPIRRLWAFTCLAIGLWAIGTTAETSASSVRTSYLWTVNCAYVGCIAIPILFFHFATLVTGFQRTKALYLGYAMAGLLYVLSFSGALFYIAPMPPFRFYTAPRPLYSLFPIFFFVYSVYAHRLLFKAVQTFSGVRQNQIKYVFWGTAIAFTGGSTTFLPVYGIPVYPYGIYAVWIFLPMVSYAIYKHHLMDIRIVFQRTLLYSSVSAILVAVYVSLVTFCARLLEGRVLEPSIYSSVAAAGAIALLFHPLRQWVAKRLDEQFYRQELERWRQRYAGALVHEIKTPLAAMSVPAELTLADMQDVLEERKAIGDVALKIQKRMSIMMARIQQASAHLDAVHLLMTLDRRSYKAVEIDTALDQAQSSTAELCQRLQVTVHGPQKDVPLYVRGSLGQLNIVFSNIIKNAAEAMMALEPAVSRTIHIERWRKKDFVTIRIYDQGSGFSVVPERFEPFMSTKGEPGRGMGLFLSQQIVLAHAGTLEARNHVGGGAEFEIKLPVFS